MHTESLPMSMRSKVAENSYYTDRSLGSQDEEYEKDSASTYDFKDEKVADNFRPDFSKYRISSCA